jgi:neutral ceramidase
VKRAVLLLLAVGCATADATPATLLAGTARTKITPAGPVMLAGYGSRNKPSEGVSAELWARALALDDGTGEPKVLVTADIIGFGPGLSRSLKAEARKRYGLSDERLLLVGSHTHSGPVTSDRTFADGLQATLLDLIGQALKAMTPARLEWAVGRAGIGMYRRVPKPDGTWAFGDHPEGPVDPDLPVMAVRDPGGALRALFFTYACHCTSIRNGKDGFYQVHPDWAICCATLEQKLPGTQAMFVTGCGADIDPAARGPLSDAEKNGASMVSSIEAVLQGSFKPVSGPIRAVGKRVALPLEKLDPEAVRKMAEKGRPAEKKFAEELLRRRQTGAGRDGPVEFPIVAWRFGAGPTIVALAGETCVEYALRLKKELGEDRVWPVGYANEVMCYIPSERVLRENGYESGWSLAYGRGVAAFQMSASGWDTPFALGLEDRIVSSVHELMKD